MNAKPLVSILMTAYNRSNYIGHAIESVLASTYQNFELLVVDDGSTDCTLDIVRRYEAKDSRVKLHQNPENLGDYPNRNRAAKLAAGEWLKYVDSDDYIYPTGLHVLMEMMSQTPDSAYGLCSTAQLSEQPFPVVRDPASAYRHHYFRKSIFDKAPLSAIIRKTAWCAVGGFSPREMTSDMDMWHRLSRKHTVTLMPLGVVWYRFHKGQETSSWRSTGSAAKQTLDYQEVVYENLVHADNPLSLDERQRIADRVSRSNFRLAARFLSHGDVRGALKMWQAASRFRHALTTPSEMPSK